MNIIDRYIWKSVIVGLFIAWFALTILVVFFDFIDESGDFNDTYTALQGSIYLLYSVPSRLYELFPTAMLIGTLLGLGNLAAHSEFVAMRAAGISIFNITISTIKLGLVLVLGIFLLGEFVVPSTDLAGRNFKSSLNNKNVVMVRGASLWVKDTKRVFHIGQVWSEDKLTDVTIYSSAKDYTSLKSITHVKEVTSSKEGWKMDTITEKTFSDKGVDIKRTSNKIEPDFLNPKLIAIASVIPEQLSIAELSVLIKHQQDNKLNSDKFELAYWKRFSAPFAALVMLFLAMPFLFGSQRGGGAGQRVFIGIVVGIAFFLLNKVLNQMGNVYGFPPIFSAFSPSILFLVISYAGMKRVT